MKILFIGLGSIGQRHLQNLKKIKEYKNSEIYCLRFSSHNLYIKDGVAREVENLNNFYNILTLNDLSEALSIKPEVVFITNPSSKHVFYAIEFARIGSSLFIEKPLSSSMEGIKELEELVIKNDIICMIGFQLRFHSFIKEIKNIITENTYGNIINAQMEWGTYLPSHHPYEDYKNSYASRKDLGGGVILSLIHELDLLLFLFGEVKDFFIVEGQNSTIGIEVEDTISSLFRFQNNEKNIPVSLNLSFSQIFETRSIKISFSDALLELNLQTNRLLVKDNKRTIVDKKVLDTFNRNDMFINEIEYFMTNIKNKNTVVYPSLEEGIKSLELALNMKKKLLNKG